MTDGFVSMLPSSDGKAIMLHQEGRAGICVVGGNAYGTVLVNTRIQQDFDLDFIDLMMQHS